MLSTSLIKTVVDSVLEDVAGDSLLSEEELMEISNEVASRLLDTDPDSVFDDSVDGEFEDSED